MSTFTAKVIQYYRPHGKQMSETTQLPKEVESKYFAMLGKGWNLAAEVLTTGQVSVTIEDKPGEMDRAIRVVANGPKVQEAYVEMLRELFPEN